MARTAVSTEDRQLEQWLVDIAVTNDMIHRTHGALAAGRSYRAMEDHAKRMRADADYARLVARLADRARNWDGTLTGFLLLSPEMEALAPALRLRPDPGLDGDQANRRRRERRAKLFRWAAAMERAPGRWEQAVALRKHLRDLTGARTDAEADVLADRLRPVVTWDALDELSAAAKRPDGPLFPLDRHPGWKFELRSLESAREELALRVLMHTLDAPGVAAARTELYQIARQQLIGTVRLVRKGPDGWTYPEVRELLVAVGVAPAEDVPERVTQLLDVIASAPEAISDYLWDIRDMARIWKQSTGCMTLIDAVKVAEARQVGAALLIEQDRGVTLTIEATAEETGSIRLTCSIPKHATRPDLEFAWSRILAAHPNYRVIGRRGRLAAIPGPGCLYVANRAGRQVVAVLADTFESAWRELDGIDVESRREWAVWVPGDRSTIRRNSPLFDRPASALGRGRPVRISSPDEWWKAPAVAGIYRIYRRTEQGEEVYVGRSRNLARRPRRHEKIGVRPWDGTPGAIVKVELIPVKPAGSSGVWTFADLDNAEEQHIARMRERQALGGPVVINSTIGRNGPPSRPPVHTYVWQPAEPANAGQQTGAIPQ